jgi:hypothetical protein
MKYKCLGQLTQAIGAQNLLKNDSIHTFSYTPENLSKVSISKWVTISHVGSILIREAIGRKIAKI